MANELGSWGVVTDPYRPPELGPEFTLPQCGCVTEGAGVPSNSTGNNGDVYVDTATEIIYQKQGDVWVVIGGGGGGGAQQVYVNSGNPNGVVTPTTTLPCLCIDTLNAVIWQKSDGLLTNTGWGSP